MANTLSTHTLRQKYFKTSLQTELRNRLVAEDICKVERSELKTIENPYITQQTAATQAVAGTYSVSAMTTTDDTLTVADEVIFGTHVFDFEKLTSNFDLTADFLEDLAYSVMEGVDKFVVNYLCETGTGMYSTPSGGFTTAANVLEIMANLIAKNGGYQGVPEGAFLIVENTDLVGIVQAQATAGTNYADSALNNGFLTNLLGVDIYVVRSGTFVSDTLGTLVVTNSGHRVFGPKGLAVFASPRGMRYEEKGVSGKTGMEIVASALIGAKIWTPHAGLFIDITIV